MQLQDADVLKLKCEFVKRFVKYLKRRTYSINANYFSAFPYFVDAYLADNLADCLTTDDICKLTKKASKYEVGIDTDNEVITCNDQVDISIASAETTCNLQASVANTGNNGAFLYLAPLLNNSTYQEGRINVTVSGCGESETTLAGSACVGETCTPETGYKLYTTLKLNNVFGTAVNSAIEYIKLSYVNNNVVTNLLLHVHPSNIAAFTGCGSCEAITASHLYLPKNVGEIANHRTAWEKLMRNIARIYTTGTNIEATVIATDLTVGNLSYVWTIKNNPATSSYWMGFDRNFPYVQTTGFSNNNPTNVFSITGTTVSIDKTITFDTACGDIDVRVTSPSISMFPTPQTNFNFVSFYDNYANVTVTPTILDSSSCARKTLTATVTTAQTISSVQWRDADNNVVGNTYVLEIVDEAPQAYTFRVTLSNGCVKTKTITI